MNTYNTYSNYNLMINSVEEISNINLLKYNLKDNYQKSIDDKETDNSSKHKSKSLNKKPFICSEKFCDKKYTSRSRLLIHLRTHVNFLLNRLVKNLSYVSIVISHSTKKEI